MPYGTPPLTRQPEHGRFNRFLAALPPHDFSLLAPHLRTIPLERGVMLHDVGEEIEHGMSLITIAILVLHLLAPAYAGSLKDAQDDIKAFRKDKGTFIFYCPRSKHAETKVQERAA